MKKILIWVVAALLVVGFGVLVLKPELLPFEQPTQEISAVETREYGRLAGQLSTLTRERDQLRSEYAQKTNGIGTLTVLFTELGQGFVDELLPTMESSGLVGMLAFTDEKYPGAEGCLTLEQWRELHEKGWEHCLYWDGAAPLDTWLTETSAQLMRMGVPMTSAIYSAAAVNESQKTVLRQHGISTVAYPTEDLAVYVADVPENGIWMVGAMPYNIDSASTRTSTINAAGGSLVMVVGDEPMQNAENLDTFGKMISTLASRYTGGTVLIAPLSDAKDHRQGVISGRSAIAAELSEKLLDLQAQIDEINRQIDELLATDD